MGIKKYGAYTPSRRHMTGSDFKGNHQENSREVSGSISG